MIGLGRTLVLCICVILGLMIGGCGQSAGTHSGPPAESSSAYDTGYDTEEGYTDSSESESSNQVSEMKDGARQNAHDTCMGAGRRAIAKEYGASGRSDLEAAEALSEHYDSAAKQDVIEGCMAGFSER